MGDSPKALYFMFDFSTAATTTTTTGPDDEPTAAAIQHGHARRTNESTGEFGRIWEF